MGGEQSYCCNMNIGEERGEEAMLQKDKGRADLKFLIDEKSSKEFGNEKSENGEKGDAGTGKFHLELPIEWTVPETINTLRSKYSPFEFEGRKPKNLVAIETDHGSYYGTLAEESPDGIGILLKNGGEVVEGYFTQGKPDKRANVYFPDGSYFSGEWKNGRIEGTGEFRHDADKGRYVGQWKDDLQWGEGEEIIQDEYHYKGGFIAGERHGYGVLALSDFSTYNGQFEKGKFHGKGKYTWSDGKEYYGQWVDGIIEGEGEFRWPDGKRYVGGYRGEKKSGFGILYWANGARYEGLWKDGKQNGKGKLILATGEEFDTNWVDGHMLKEG